MGNATGKNLGAISILIAVVLWSGLVHASGSGGTLQDSGILEGKPARS